MMSIAKHKVPEPTVKRLPVYLHLLKNAYESGVLTLSAPMIGKELGWDPTQVVKDLAATGASGKPRIGYNVHDVIRCIENFLGFDRPNDAILVGAGNLGEALMSYPRFRDYGLNIVAAIDSDPEKAGKSKSGINILSLNKCEDLCAKLEIRIAILTTPAEVAQELSEKLVRWGIRAIWNLTPARLNLPEHVVVQDTSMYSNVAILLKKLEEKEKLEPTS